MKQEQRRQQTFQLLLQTVEELIVEKGCESIKMSDIMERSGLSKGAIFHYVKTKDEIFALLLQEQLEEIDNRFVEEVNQQKKKEFEGPLREITKKLSLLENPQDVTNQVLMYLLGKKGQPSVAEALQAFYEQSFRLSKQWIVTGQNHGVIPESIDADKTAELFMLISYGLRMRSAIPAGAGTPSFTAADFAMFLANTLNPKTSDRKEP
ncbi:TetR/AcrR family transcriptional regulator [Paenibacillus hemerocallicola]|uniref:TetR/AcrR family transcriptional regulator n=1 Tax=Paenibacillus hemerocallicola TaxID=1172614 RepID=A0A5C4SVJ3_9BACL|nr:TetR/AcrR family transcriptional regulator [Paenibacillus hemerocallicola]TNJ53807.1 TetR/AcrR family transcriptional regulator [Paenibacillus hemerocallicola]